MNFQFYIEKLHSSEEFEKFRKENPNAYFCSAFISVDKEGKDNKIHLDYFNPENKKGFSFQLEDGIKLSDLENFGEGSPMEISEEIDFNLEQVESLILEKMEKENIKNKIQKILLSLQDFDGKTVLSATVFISMMGILKFTISLPEIKIEDFQKKSFFDMVNVLKKS
jgi:hypothetical protein